MSDLPLSNLRVIDFCWIGAGSFMTKILADLGADVLKIESNKSLDSLRLAPPFKNRISGVNRSGYFADRNSSKKSITINMKDPRGVDLVLSLLANADVIANNFRPGVMDRLGVGYEQVHAINPGIVYIGMSMNGDEGPDRAMLGYGITIAALTGFLGQSGYPDRPPVGTGTNYPDHVPNPAHGAFAVMAALRHKLRTGEGQKIDLAQTEPMLALMPLGFADYLTNGRVAMRTGNRLGGFAPRGVYPTLGNDRWIAISIATDEQWKSLVEVLGAGPLDRAEWDSFGGREAAADEIDDVLADLLRGRDGYAVMAALQERRIAAGVVQDASDLVDRDPQLKHRNHWVYLPHEEMGETLYNGPPYRFASKPIGPRFAAPRLGEHTEQILSERVGLDAASLRKLIKDEVLV